MDFIDTRIGWLPLDWVTCKAQEKNADDRDVQEDIQQRPVTVRQLFHPAAPGMYL
jgi:hypothetical protein